MEKNLKLGATILAIAISVLALVLALLGGGTTVVEKGFGGSTSDDWNVGGDLTVAGNSTLTGDLITKFPYTTVAGTVGSVVTTTLTAADTGKTFLISNASGTPFVLPSTSTSAGLTYRFVINGAIGTDVTIQTSDLGNDIEGALIVAGAVVNCDAEDIITFVADGENIGDYLELYSDGTHWLIGDSGALTGSKLTCSTS